MPRILPATSFRVIKSAGLLSKMFVGAHQLLNEDDLGTMLREQYNSNKGLDSLDPAGVRPSSILSRAAARNRENPDVVPFGSPLTRTAIPSDQLTKDDLRAMGFKPSLVAVPERGQSELMTWRHPRTGLHLHRHSSDWLFHEDKWPSISMLAQREKALKPDIGRMELARRVVGGTLTEGLPHVLFEGVPGYANFIAGALSGAPTFDQQLARTREARRFAPWRRAISEPDSFHSGRVLHTLAAAGLLGSAAAAFGGTGVGAAVGGGALGLVAGNQIAGAIQRRFPGVSKAGPAHFAVAGGIPLGMTYAGVRSGQALARWLQRKKQENEEREKQIA